MRDTLHDFESRINRAKANVEAMHHIMEVTYRLCDCHYRMCHKLPDWFVCEDSNNL